MEFSGASGANMSRWTHFWQEVINSMMTMFNEASIRDSAENAAMTCGAAGLNQSAPLRTVPGREFRAEPSAGEPDGSGYGAAARWSA